MIFPTNTITDRFSKLAWAILAYITPPALEREKKLKAELAERQRKGEEERKRREEEERKAREAKEAQERAERERKEAEERERVEQAAAEAAARAQAEAAEGGESEEFEAMEGVETAETTAPAQTQLAADQPRVLTTIRGEEVDVTELGIDPDYLEALPEEFREEVIAQTVSQRRSAAREAAEATRAGEQQTEAFQEFLDALPEDLRHEIVQQERQEQRRREREEARRAIVSGNGEALPQDMDAASILLTFSPALRDQVLMEQGEELMDHLPPEMLAQAQRLARQNPEVVRPGQTRAAPVTQRPGEPPAQPSNEQEKVQRRTVVQMLDKSGVATLLRLMFINVKGGSLEVHLRNVFKDVCENRQNRLEVVSTLLQILLDGTTDVDAVERSFAQLSIKARQPKDKDPKTPTGLKRSLTGHEQCRPSSFQHGDFTTPYRAAVLGSSRIPRSIERTHSVTILD